MESIIGFTIDKIESIYETLPENEVGSLLKSKDSFTSAFTSRAVISIFSKSPSSKRYPDIPVLLESINHWLKSRFSSLAIPLKRPFFS